MANEAKILTISYFCIFLYRWEVDQLYLHLDFHKEHLTGIAVFNNNLIVVKEGPESHIFYVGSKETRKVLHTHTHL